MLITKFNEKGGHEFERNSDGLYKRVWREKHSGGNGVIIILKSKIKFKRYKTVTSLRICFKCTAGSLNKYLSLLESDNWLKN